MTSVPVAGITPGRARAAFVAASVSWMLALAAAPIVAGRPHASAVGAWFVVAVYAAGSIVCHQLPERSFHLWSAQFPVCARCTGIYLAAAIAAVVAARRARLARRDAAPNARSVLVLAALPTVATLVYEWTTAAAPANWIRCAAGIPLGASVAWLIVAASMDQVN